MWNLINGILNSWTDVNTIDTEIRAMEGNIRKEKQVTYLLHKRWPAIETVKYETYYKPTRARAWLSWVWNNSAVTWLAVKADTTKILDMWMVLKIWNEVVVVKDINRTANTISVYSRGAGWTTATSHTDETAILIHTVAVPEGKVVGEGLFQEHTKSTNTIQMFQKKVSATYTDAQARRKTMEDHLTDMEQQQFEELRIDQDVAALYGTYDEGDSDGTTPRMSRWIVNSILEWGNANLVNVASSAWTETRMNQMFKAIWKEGWTVDTVLMSIDNKVVTNGFGSFQKRIEDTRWNTLWATNDAVAAEWIGDVFIEVDNNIKNADVLYVNTDDMEVANFVNDAIRIEVIENWNPRVIEKLIHWQEGFNYTNINRNFALDTNLTT